MSKPIVLAALIALAAAAGPAPGPFHQDYFVLSFWGDPPVDNLIGAKYAEVDAAHFNVVLGGMGADSPDKAKQQRDACKKYDLKVVFSTYGLPIDQLCNCETTYGFLVRDHPSAADFPALLKRVDDIRRLRPGKLPLVNLPPNTTSPNDLGTDNYQAYIEKFCAEIHPEVLCFDHYPTFAPEADGRASFCDNLAVIRSAALKQKVPFWCFVKAMACDSPAIPTEAQINWQVYTALAYGAKGILYSSYATPTGDKHFTGSGIIGPDGKPTERYAQVKTLNAALKNLGNMLMHLASTGVFRVTFASSMPSASPVAVTPKEAGDEFLVGTFARGGQTAILIVNYHERGAASSATLTADAGRTFVEVSKRTGKTQPAQDQDPALDGLQISLAPGEGRLFLLEN